MAIGDGVANKGEESSITCGTRSLLADSRIIGEGNRGDLYE